MSSTTITIPCTYNEYESLDEGAHTLNIKSGPISSNQRAIEVQHICHQNLIFILELFFPQAKTYQRTELFSMLCQELYDTLFATSCKNLYGNVSINFIVKKSKIDGLGIKCTIQESVIYPAN